MRCQTWIIDVKNACSFYIEGAGCSWSLDIGHVQSFQLMDGTFSTLQSIIASSACSFCLSGSHSDMGPSIYSYHDRARPKNIWFLSSFFFSGSFWPMIQGLTEASDRCKTALLQNRII